MPLPYAIAFEPAARRRGRAPGTGNVIFQKFVSAFTNSMFVTSRITQTLRPYWGVYAASKAALEALVVVYAGEIARTMVRANLISPGPLRTHMRAQAMPGEDPTTLQPPAALAPDIVRMLSPDFVENGVLFDFARGETKQLGGDR